MLSLTLILLLPSSILVLVNAQQMSQICPAPTRAPFPMVLGGTSANYPYLENGLQVFTNLIIPCNGVINEWRFLTQFTTINGLHLATFRPVAGGGFLFVSDTYVNNFNTNAQGQSWVSFRPIYPPGVQVGDVIGIFYDQLTTSSDLITVTVFAYSENSQQADNQNTIVTLQDASSMILNQTVIQQGTSGAITFRAPALFCFLTSLANAQGVTRAPTTSFLMGGFLMGDFPTPSSRLVGQRGPVNPFAPQLPPSPPASTTNPAPTPQYNAQFRNLKCNLLPNFSQTSCPDGSNPTTRFYYDILATVCRPFYGCSSKTPQGGEWTWQNNFDNEQKCLTICTGSQLLRG